MIRECSLSDISDGRVYSINDMVKCDTMGCIGCSKCCRDMGSSIKLDPLDIYRIKKVKDIGFEALIQQGLIELNMVDGLILPNLKMNEKNSCSFLDESGRCSIHESRPGICRLFPLGRVYQEGEYNYFLQSGECTSKVMSKIKVKKWADSESSKIYRDFILAWHDFIRKTGDDMKRLKLAGRGEVLNDRSMYVLNRFFVEKSQADNELSFIAEVLAKIDEAEMLLGLVKKQE